VIPADLKSRREALGLTQSALAERLGVSVQAVRHWEQGVRPIPAMLELALECLKRRAGARGRR
jgi:transcriptional regulator with XRE-family HTH domain